MTTAKRTHLSLMLAAIALLVALGVGCNRARSDMQVATDVQSKINADGNLPNKQITVNANNGVVTLSGTVGSDAERTAAANDAAQVDGVKTVIDHMTVGTQTAQNMGEQQQMPEEPAPSYSAPSRSRTSRPRRPSGYSSRSTETTSASNSNMNPNYSTNETSSSTTPAAPAPAPPKPVTIPDGTTLSVRMIDSVDSDRNKPGDIFHATLDAPIMVEDQVIVPQGADVQGRVATLKTAGHYIGQSQIALELTKLSFNGKTYPLTTDQYTQQGASRGKNTAAKVGTGAAIGAVIGAIAGGGKGAGIGSVIGAGAGGGVQTVTKGEQIHIRPEALLTFRMQNPVTVTPGRGSQYNNDTYNDNGSNNSNNTYNDQNSTPDNTNNTNSTDRPTLKRRPPTQ